jgi:hypothetical protein
MFHRKSVSPRRRVRVGVESLEGRQLLYGAAGLATVAAVTNNPPAQVFMPAPAPVTPAKAAVDQATPVNVTVPITTFTPTAGQTITTLAPTAGQAPGTLPAQYTKLTFEDSSGVKWSEAVKDTEVRVYSGTSTKLSASPQRGDTIDLVPGGGVGAMQPFTIQGLSGNTVVVSTYQSLIYPVIEDAPTQAPVDYTPVTVTEHFPSPGHHYDGGVLGVIERGIDVIMKPWGGAEHPDSPEVPGEKFVPPPVDV